MTMVRRTQSSLSHASSGTSVTCPPFLVDAVRQPRRDVPAQDAVTEQAEAAQVREARPLGQTGQDREVKRRAQAGHRQVDVDPPLEPGLGLAEAPARFVSEERLEPATTEADRHDDQVISDTLALATVLDGDDDLLVARVDSYRPPGERTVSCLLYTSPSPRD